MKHKRLVAGVLSLALACTILSPLQLAFAEASEGGSDGGDSSSETEGLELSKTAVANGDGTYTIKLEAYATGSSITSVVSKDIPTDIVLVLDQSGSMANPIGTVSFKLYEDTQNSNYYNLRHNGGDANLYYQLGDGSYAAVSVKREGAKETQKQLLVKKRNSSYTNWSLYNSYSDSLYAMVDEELQKITIERHGYGYWDNYYTYTLPNGTSALNNSDFSSDDETYPKFKYDIYTISIDDRNATYTYTYVDANGDIKTIGTSIGAGTSFDGAILYQRVVNEYAGGTRLDALKTAVTTFANSVAEKAKGADGLYNTEDDVDHRIAVVGFASDGYDNTELLTGVTITSGDYYGTVANTYYSYYYPTGYAKNGASYYSEITLQQYQNALQSIKDTIGKQNVLDAIDALTAHGGTMIDQGIDMANQIFENNPVEEGKRNRIIVVFTDGAPGEYGNWQSASRETANDAIQNANTAKNTYKATVYTVGVFSGADASNPDSLPQYTVSGAPTTAEQKNNSNRFMHLLSSNYPNATSMSNPGSLKENLTGSYYLSAADSSTLTNIFQKISEQINTSTSSTTLNKEAFIQDVIAPAFELKGGSTAAGTDITCEVYSYKGPNVTDKYAWEYNSAASSQVEAYVDKTVKGEKTVNVTGFDYAYNWVGTATNNGVPSYRGQKLVISFKVKPKDGFLGGNNVYTNTEACVYKDLKDLYDENPLLRFERPQVNVPIDDVEVTAANKNVYLYGSVTAGELQGGATVKVGNVDLDLDDYNFGLESWQNEYVDIVVSVKDQNGNVVSDSLSNLTDDQTYTIEVTVSPKDNGAGASGTHAVSKDGSDSANINVFKPELTFGDSEVYYGDTVPTDFSENLDSDSTVWKHGDTSSTDTRVTMIGTAPTLGFVYAPDSNKIADGKINTKEDIDVDVTVKIGDIDVTNKTTFHHTNCEGKICTVSDGKFLLHVKTCQLTVTKSGGNSNESYTFDIYRNDQKYSEVTIWGNGSQTIYELPVGSYTITESTGANTGWSWRFGQETSTTVELKANDAEKQGTITCTNNADASKTKWLNGYSAVERNIYRQPHTSD